MQFDNRIPMLDLITRICSDLEVDGLSVHQVGPYEFRGLGARTVMRVRYRATDTMPNAPRSGLYRGPADAELELEL